MRRSGMSIVALAFGLFVTPVPAQEGAWRGAQTKPGITLGRPVPASAEAPATTPTEAPIRAFTIIAPERRWAAPPARIVRGQIGDAPADMIPPPPPPPPPPPDLFGPAKGPKQTSKYGSGGSPEYPIFDASRDWVNDTAGAVGGWFQPTEGRGLFQSDHAFDHMISPVSSPFRFEDPRSLSEIRPILILQDSPRSNPVFAGGENNFFGVQARLAITERLSIVLNKFGWIWMDPAAPTGAFSESNGFAELWVGPKYTLIRNTDTCTLLALGVTFEIPTGPSRVFQDTGSLSVAPYLSFGQNFGKTNWGSFNFLNTTGYTFATDNQRTDYFYSCFHLDFDVANFHKIYPLLEINWYHYAQNGNVQDLNFEGKDLYNFGSKGIAGFDELNLAVGLRYKFTEAFQLGAAFEFPLLGNSSRRIDDFRFTFDVIFRY